MVLEAEIKFALYGSFGLFIVIKTDKYAMPKRKTEEGISLCRRAKVGWRHNLCHEVAFSEWGLGRLLLDLNQ